MSRTEPCNNCLGTGSEAVDSSSSNANKPCFYCQGKGYLEVVDKGDAKPELTDWLEKVKRRCEETREGQGLTPEFVTHSFETIEALVKMVKMLQVWPRHGSVCPVSLRGDMVERCTCGVTQLFADLEALVPEEE